MDDRKFSKSLEVALSGGGFRATAFGLGVLLYLADSGLNKQVKTISSVSGGSIANGFVASECDFAAMDEGAQFRAVAARLAQIISGKGTFSGFWLISRPPLICLLVSGVIILAWLTNLLVAGLVFLFWDIVVRPVSSTEVFQCLAAVLVWGVAALNRGELVFWWISRTFLRSKPVTLGSVSGRAIDHVFCATDLTSSSPLFFSTKGGGRIYSQSYGRGEGKDVALKRAIGASAAFPPLIPPEPFKLFRHRFSGEGSPPRTVWLSDGGVWNNLGTDWSRLRNAWLTAEQKWLKGLPERGGFPVIELMKNCPMAAVLLIANASKPEVRKNLWLLKVPGFSFFATLIRVLNVTVNSTVEARSADVEKTARTRMLNDPDQWELGEDAPRPQGTVWGEGEGTAPPLAVMIEMTRKPGETAKAYRMIGGLEQWRQKPDEYLEELQAPLQKLQRLLDGDDVVRTTLDNLGPRDTLRLIVLGYLNTRETLTVAFANHTPPPCPAPEWFEELLQL